MFTKVTCVALALFAAVYAEPGLPVVAAPATLLVKDTYAVPNYSFNYGVNDPHTGDHKSQSEVRHGDVVKGQYSLAEPDGTIRTVDYTADPVNGFNAVVSKSGHAVHPAPIVKTIVAAPVVKTVVAAPAIVKAPIVAHAPVLAAPAYTTYAAQYPVPAVYKSPIVAAPAVYKSFAAPVAAYASPYAAYASPYAQYAAPLAYRAALPYHY